MEKCFQEKWIFCGNFLINNVKNCGPDPEAPTEIFFWKITVFQAKTLSFVWKIKKPYEWLCSLTLQFDWPPFPPHTLTIPIPPSTLSICVWGEGAFLTYSSLERRSVMNHFFLLMSFMTATVTSYWKIDLLCIKRMRWFWDNLTNSEIFFGFF